MLRCARTAEHAQQNPTQVALEAFENADVPFHLVLLEASSAGDAGASFAPVFQSMFFLHDQSWSQGLHLDGCTTGPLHNIEKSVARCVRACVHL